MARPLPKALWIAAIIAAFAAILSVASRSPEPTAPPATPDKQENSQPDPELEKKAPEPSLKSFVQQAHREALGQAIDKLESMMPTLALWELLRVDAPVKPPYAVFSNLSYTQARALEGLASDLSEIDRTQLDPKGKIYHRSAQFIVARALNSNDGVDPLSTLRLTQRVSDSLLGAWLRRENPKAWLEPVRSLAQQWEHVRPKDLNAAQRSALRRETRELLERLQRWQSPDAQAFVAPEWQPVLSQLERGLKDYSKANRGRALAAPASKGDASFSEKQWETWTRWELGHSPQPKQAATAIIQSAKRLSAIQERLTAPNKRSNKARPDLDDCQKAREQLHTQVPTPGPWIEHKVSCEALIALAPPQDTQALMHALVLHGWVDPTRLEVRRQQRPLIAGLASRWGASVHAQMRELMFLAQLPVQDWSQLRQRSIVDALRADLCHSFVLLRSLKPELQSAPPSLCAPKRRTAQRPDAHAALRGIRVAAMPQTRARMAGLDRFYWAPPKLALYWATPSGQDPDSAQDPVHQAPPLSSTIERLQRTP